MYPSSVVHTGVKSLGCENKIAQPSPIHSWKLMVPCEDSAVKFGASSFIRNMHALLRRPVSAQYHTLEACFSRYKTVTRRKARDRVRVAHIASAHRPMAACLLQKPRRDRADARQNCASRRDYASQQGHPKLNGDCRGLTPGIPCSPDGHST